MEIEADKITIEGPDGQATLVFTEADEAQRLSCNWLIASHFALPLTESQHVEREEYLDQQPLARGLGWRYWCLAQKDNPDRVLSVCRTTRREFFICEAGRDVRTAHGYCISAVTTEASYQGLGLATYLLDKVATWMDGLGVGELSILYSNAGLFYAKRGWQEMPTLQISMPGNIKAIQLPAALPRSRALCTFELKPLCERDVSNMRVTCGLLQMSPGAKTMACPPTYELVSFFQARTGFIGQKLYGSAPIVYGSICEDEQAWICWVHHFKREQLLVQRVAIDHAMSSDRHRVLIRLLSDAVSEAHKWNLQSVVLWSPNSEVQAAAAYMAAGAPIEVEKRKSNLPMIRWKGGDTTVDTKWMYNEFYCY